jgi:hypothetical protein
MEDEQDWTLAHVAMQHLLTKAKPAHELLIRIRNVPLKTVPYQTEDLLPSVTSPMTAALGATKAPSPMTAFFVAKLIIVLCL